jgi:hypothetical protein
VGNGSLGPPVLAGRKGAAAREVWDGFVTASDCVPGLESLDRGVGPVPVERVLLLPWGRWMCLFEVLGLMPLLSY